MKKVIYAMCIALALIGCEKKDDVQSSKKVTFHIDQLIVEHSNLAPARTEESTPTEAGLTDLWLFEGTTLLAHQTNTDADFGSPELELTYGQHTITVIGSSTDNQTFTDGVWAGKDPKDCFGAVHNLNVTSTTGEQNIVLTRCYYAVQWKSEDVVPAEAKTVEVVIGGMRRTLLAGLSGGTGSDYHISATVTSYIGKVLTVSAYGFTDVYGEEESLTTTYTIKDAEGTVIVKHEKEVPVLSGRATIIKGSMFGTPASASVMVDNKALTNYEVSL